MFWIDLLFAIVVAGLLVTLFALAFRVRGPWNNILWFFLVVLLAAWAGGVWLMPVGPSLGGAYLLPFALAGVVAALLLAAATLPPPEKGRTVELIDEKEQKARRWIAGTALTAFFWLLLLVLAAAIVFKYVV